MSEGNGKVERNGSRAGRQKAARRSFSEEFKKDAVRLVAEEGYSFKAAAQAVGVGEVSLRQWHAKYAPAASSSEDNATSDELRDENKRLRAQLRRAELERDILKKATAFFAKESQ